MRLPEGFCARMREMLGEEYAAYAACYEDAEAAAENSGEALTGASSHAQALRVNPLKCSAAHFLELADSYGWSEEIAPVPWEPNGFYYEEELRPGKSPAHETGMYYIQEPSAMAAAPLLGAQPGERVLDLCAAPGGKSTQLAAAMQGKGLLICNEIHPARAKILSQNIERLGVKNAIVTNEDSAKLAAHFPSFFDRILVDAPCSGEGMFRKEEAALEMWTPENVEMCAARQREILDNAASMLADGGTIVYSTCTFAPAEDEEQIVSFLERHPEFTAVDISEDLNERYASESQSDTDGQQDILSLWSWSKGRPDWTDAAHAPELRDMAARTARLWPHKLRGEGHFAAKLVKEAKGGARGKAIGRAGAQEPSAQLIKLWKSWAQENLTEIPEGKLVKFGEELYLMPEDIPLAGLKVVRAGLDLGCAVKDRFEPGHALAMVLRPEDVKRSVNLGAQSREAAAWLRGESAPCEGSGKGWCLVTGDGCSMGWGKMSGGMVKNHYPKGLRRNY